MNAVVEQGSTVVKDWTKRAAAIHRGVGGSAFSLRGVNVMLEGALLSNRTHDLFRIKGDRLHADQIRRFLWEHRKDRCLQDADTVLWTAYNEETNESFVGLARPITDNVVERAERMGLDISVIDFRENTHG